MAELKRTDTVDLVAFLDGEMSERERTEFEAVLSSDAALQERLANLDRGGMQARASLAAILDDAPKDRLDALLANALNGEERKQARPERRFMRLQMIAATVAIFILGGLVGGLIAQGGGSGGGVSGNTAPEGWRQAVAEYWTLTTPETLATAPPALVANAELVTAGQKLGLDLQPVAGKVPDLSFRGVQLFDFRGRPLVQIAYLDPAHGPIAYCIIADPSNADRPKTNEALDGFNIVHWANGGHARLLIGRAPVSTLQSYADRLDG